MLQALQLLVKGSDLDVCLAPLSKSVKSVKSVKLKSWAKHEALMA